MCEVYASTPRERYDSSTRSVRLSGFVTSIRLENEFWSILEKLSAEQHLSVPQFITEIHDEVLERQGEVRNLASLLRVCCARYLERQIPDDTASVSAVAESG